MSYDLHWTAGLHHDGSSLYVSNPLPASGEAVTLRLRAPLDAPIRAVFVRSAPDGEHHFTPMRRAETGSVSAWWTGDLRITMPRNPYRFKILTDEGAYWLTAAGVSRADGPDNFDFKLLADFAAPSWVNDAVFYQIFPDRFFNGDPSNDVPPGAWRKHGVPTQQREWGAPPLSWREGENLDFYGGDLTGITQKLDYLRDLGVNALYLNPIFTSHSNHRYDIIDYTQVDPHLGGNTALVELRQALDRAGMRLVLDVTPNHCSSEHPWFTAAQADLNAPTAAYFTFYRHPDEYECWLGHRSLPKLNYLSETLREAMYGAPDSILRRWLAEPYRIDGWRLDVLNMTARQGMAQLGNKITRAMRRAVKGDSPQAYFIGEHFFDGTTHLQGDELDGVMNYQGFNFPVRRWLAGCDLGMENGSPAADRALLPAEALAEQWTRYRAAVPWSITRQQFNQLGSHDTARILTAVGGDKALLRLGVALLMTYPGVPCVYYGDEIGMEGGGDPDCRRCMRWDESTWDKPLRAYYQQLIALRRSAPALVHGGFQGLYASDGLTAYQRQSPEQRLIVIGYRGPGELAFARIPVRHGGLADGGRLTDLLGGREFMVQDGDIRLDRLAAGTVLILADG